MEDIPNIRNLAAFFAIAKHGSVTGAAAAIHLTQPALTQAVARLESSLGCQLFEREPSGMRLTQVAELLAPRVGNAITRIGSNRITAAQIRAFRALVRNGSYAAAAEETQLAPASLHRAVADLSLELGEKLVERRGRHLTITSMGKARARQFGLALADLRSGLAEVSAWLGQAGERIVIGAMPLSRARWLPQSILAFQRSHSAVQISIVEGTYADLLGPLRDGDIDFLLGALRNPDTHNDLEQLHAFDDQPMIVMRQGHPLSTESSILVDSLRSFGWVLPGPKTPLHQYWTSMFDNGETSPPDLIACGSVLTIRELVLNSDMLTLLSPDQFQIESRAGLLWACPPPITIARAIGITTRKDWKPTQTQTAMLNILLRDKNHSS